MHRRANGGERWRGWVDGMGKSAIQKPRLCMYVHMTGDLPVYLTWCNYKVTV